MRSRDTKTEKKKQFGHIDTLKGELERWLVLNVYLSITINLKNTGFYKASLDRKSIKKTLFFFLHNNSNKYLKTIYHEETSHY